MNDVLKTLPIPVVVSEEERLRRIGAFICGLAALEPPPPPNEPPPPIISGKEAGPENRVLGYLASGREASPIEIRLTLGLSRSMAYRTLRRLSLASAITSRGCTKALVYRALVVDPARN
ncbi:MAG TPA: hypothetical protein PKX00_01035 [Opitutaceae bacterium]|jgi:hypothetical protein|nr:hypothetical protein [Opitutaceae bacterium]